MKRRNFLQSAAALLAVPFAGLPKENASEIPDSSIPKNYPEVYILPELEVDWILSENSTANGSKRIFVSTPNDE